MEEVFGLAVQIQRIAEEVNFRKSLEAVMDTGDWAMLTILFLHHTLLQRNRIMYAAKKPDIIFSIVKLEHGIMF